MPARLELDLFDGSAWLGIVPFRLTNMRVRGLVPLPGLSTAIELNVRTYVTYEGRPGVWFFTLDTSSRVLAEAGRRLFRLPYRQAPLRMRPAGDAVEVESDRDAVRYRGGGPLFRAEPGSLEEFLVERYCLYAADGERLFRAEIHHLPWDLQRLELQLLASADAPEATHHGLFAPRQDAVVWPLSELR